MNTTYETYMNALKQGLASFDSAAAEEILNDFESHFADARSQGLSDEEICAELGNVDDVLEFFRQEYATTEQPVANVLPQEKIHSNSEETHPNYPYAPSTAITAMEISLRNASADFAPGTSASVEFDFSGDFDPDRFEAGIEGNTFCLREKKLIPSVFWKHLFCNNHQKEVFSFQVPSTVQKLTLRSLNGATGLDTLSLTTLEISATNGKITGDSLSASSCRIQAANGKIVLTRLRTDSLDVSATNGRLEITGGCSRASLNSVNGKVLFEGTCSEYLTAKSVNGSENSISRTILPMRPFMHPRQPEKSASSPMEERNPTQKHSPAPVFLHSPFRQVPSTEMSCSLTCRQKTDKKEWTG